MLIQNHQKASTIHRPRGEKIEKPKSESSPALDGFTTGANLTATIGIYGGSTLLGIGGAQELVFKSLFAGDETASAVASVVVGGLVGAGAGYAINKGLDKLGNAVSKTHGKKVSALAKTALIGVAGFESGEVAAACVGTIAAGGVLGGGAGLIADKFRN